jgi:hypothetical protein
MKAHKRELRQSSRGAGKEVAQNGMHETQMAVPHEYGIQTPPSSRKASNLSVPQVTGTQSSPRQTASNISVPQATGIHFAPQEPSSTAIVHEQDAIVAPANEPPQLQGNTSGSRVDFAVSLTTGEGPSRLSRASKRGSVTGIVNELRETVFKKRVGQMQSALADHRVMVNRHLLKQRLILEYNLVVGSWKLLRWLLCFVPLIWCLNIFEPGNDIGNVHEMLIDHYGIDHNTLLNLKEWDHVYGFFHRFKEQNDLLEPTGKIFWCDPRYLDMLGITTAGATEFLRQQELASLVATGSAIISGGSSGSSGGRRLEGDHSQIADKSKDQFLSGLRKLSSTSSGSSVSASSSSSSSSSSTSTSVSLEQLLLSLKHVYQNPTPLGVDPHGHERFLFDCRIPTDMELVDIHHKLEAARLGNITVTDSRRRRTDGYGPLNDYKTYFPNEFNETYSAYINHVYVNKTEPDTGTYLSRYHYPYNAISLFDPVIYQPIRAP